MRTSRMENRPWLLLPVSVIVTVIASSGYYWLLNIIHTPDARQYLDAVHGAAPWVMILAIASFAVSVIAFLKVRQWWGRAIVTGCGVVSLGVLGLTIFAYIMSR